VTLSKKKIFFYFRWESADRIISNNQATQCKRAVALNARDRFIFSVKISVRLGRAFSFFDRLSANVHVARHGHGSAVGETQAAKVSSVELAN
jgi:hypothetical protein